MADAVLALTIAGIVQSAVIVSGAWLYQRAEAAHRRERSELLNRIAAGSPREFAAMQRVTEPKPDTHELAEEEPIQIGIS